MKNVLRIIGGIALGIVLVFGALYLSFKGYEYFRPKYVAVDNKIFQESQQYNEGMLRDLQMFQMEYINGDQGKKDAIRAIVMHRFSVYPQEKLPADLRTFYDSLKAGK